MLKGKYEDLQRNLKNFNPISIKFFYCIRN